MKGRDEEAQKLSQAKAELALMTEKNAELMEEVRVCHCLHMCVNVSPNQLQNSRQMKASFFLASCAR